mmetsp:Transcript_30072/g.26651  ORF Transcript_30072/g.26651 Transcript_30072/m.26651 type:complete len:169 (-) Transcript_30072:192-698(-)
MIWGWAFTLAMISLSDSKPFDDNCVTTFIFIFAIQTPRFVVSFIWIILAIILLPCRIRRILKERTYRMDLLSRIRDMRNSESLIQPPDQIRIFIDSERAETQRLLIVNREDLFRGNVPERISRGSLRRRIVNILLLFEEETKAPEQLPVEKLKRISYSDFNEEIEQDQ